MSAVRRGYVYLVSFVSLQSVAWAVISLLRNLLTPGKYAAIESTAFQIAVIVIGLPIFVVHWLWAQRLAGRDLEERGAVLRRLYLYGVMASFLGPFIANAFDLLDTLVRLVLGLSPEGSYRYPPLSQTDLIIHNLVAMVVLAVLWLYHWRVLVTDTRTAPEKGNSATVRRLYAYGFSAAGLAMTILAVIGLLRWLMFQVGGETITSGNAPLTREVARLLVGLPVWLIFWSWAQSLVAGPDEEERASTLRKMYLYSVVFIAVLGTVTAATFVLAGVFRRLLAVSSRGGNGDIREALPIIIGLGIVWAYHAYVLRRDAALVEEQPEQAWVQQLYRYLVAAIGLGAFLVGLGGVISFLIRFLSGVRFVSGLPDEVAWFSAVLIAGLPVWILPWRQCQIAAAAPGTIGDEESRSIVRRIYLYFFLFVATMTVLSSGVYIVSRLIGLALGARAPGNLLADLAQAIAFTLIAVLVWLYHGSVLRGDSQRARQVLAQRLASLRVTVLDVGDGSLGRALLDELRRDLPGANLQPIGLTPEASAALGTSEDPPDIPTVLAESGVIIGPWTIAVAGAAVGAVSAETAHAVSASPARKLLIPVREAGWDWAGVDDLKIRDIIQQTVRAVKQIAAGEEVTGGRALGAGAIIALVIGGLIVLATFVLPLILFFMRQMLD